MLYRVSLALAVGVVLAAAPAAAQNRFSIDLNAGGAFVTNKMAGSDLEDGLGFGFAANVRVMPHMHIYAGWDYHRFAAKPLLFGAEDLDDTGYALGAKFQHPVMTRVDLWARAGGIYNHIELEDDAGELIADSGHELGWEAGGGAAFMVTDRFSIMPGTRYRTYSADLTVGATTVPVDLTYVTAEIMLSWKLGNLGLSARR